MASNKKYTTDFSNRALETIMREVLNGMEECLLEAAYEKPGNAGFEIIDIHPPRKRKKLTSIEKANNLEAAIIDFSAKKQRYN